MAFVKGMPRPAGAGRKKGSLNKKKVLRVEEVLIKENINPIEEILKLIPKLQPAEQVKSYFDLLKYLQPTLKAQEVNPDDYSSSEEDEEENLTDELTNEELIKLVKHKKAT
jgi:hypothetical protein